MARIGVSITKSTTFRDSVQEFTNVYYYEMLNLPNEAEAQTLLGNLVSLEKTFHTTNVIFVRGRVWSQGGSPGANNMITQQNLSGTGARAFDSNWDKERAWLFRLRAGSDSRGNPVYLRKWYHSVGAFFSGQVISAAIYANTTGISASDKTSMRAQMQAIGDANGSAGAPKLCAKSGRVPTVGEVWQPHTYLEHHQLGDQWRAQ